MLNRNYSKIRKKRVLPQSNHKLGAIEYFQKYFDVQTNEVIERIVSSVLPHRVPRNYFDKLIKSKPDLYGPIWISLTLILTIAVTVTISNYIQSVNKRVFLYYDILPLVLYAATAIVCYVWIVPLALWAALKWTIHPNRHEIENQTSNSLTVISLFCLYGYSLSIYIPVAVLWTIQVSWLQWLLVVMAACVSGYGQIFWLLPVLKRSNYFYILVGSIIGQNFLLARGLMLYFFYVPAEFMLFLQQMKVQVLSNETWWYW